MASSTCSTPIRKIVSCGSKELPKSDTRGTTPTANIYTSFEDLTNRYIDNNSISSAIEDLKQLIIPEANWKDHFDAIENLRVLNKYYPNEIRKYLGQFSDFLQKSLDNLRSNVSKNALMFIKEVFQLYRDSHTSEGFLIDILPTVLEKAVSEKGFLKNEARAALKALEKTGCNNNVIKVLCDKSFDKNGVISELSFQSLADIVQEAKENLSEKINQEHIEILFQTIAQSIDGKRAVNKRVAKGLCMELKGIFSEQDSDFERFMREKTKLKESEIKLIMESLKKTVHNTKPDFSGFLKTKKFKQEADKNDPANFTFVSINLKK